ncbi:tricarboxylate transporter [Chelativorans alearense]|uniref:tricarboxylate transporter n=1 Tax=Chelativorans alearense TaxID=2681495 RepID=UPI001969A50F|nr:tricarboxylate transporter [Chelativorans alearense]
MNLLKGSRSALGRIAVAFLASGISTTPTLAQDLAEKTAEFVIPFAESGGSARWANFFAPLLSEHLPGNPVVVVKYRPGAGSTAGANWFQEQTTNDGTLIFGTSGSTQFPYLLGDPRVRYEYRDWKIVLASGTGGVVYLPPDLGERFDGDFDDLQDELYLFGTPSVTTLDLVPLLTFKMLGLDVDAVTGIEGRGNGRLMFERGEANIDYQTTPAYLKSVVPLVEQGLAVPAFAYGFLDDEGNIVRDPTFPDLPSFKEVCEATAGCETSGPAWDAWKVFFTAGFAAQKMVFLPGTASQETVDMYEKAFKEIVARPDFMKAAEVDLGVYPQMTGKAAIKAYESAINVSPEAKQFVLDWLKDDYGVELK